MIKNRVSRTVVLSQITLSLILTFLRAIERASREENVKSRPSNGEFHPLVISNVNEATVYCCDR